MSDLSKMEPVQIVDVLGRVCPYPLLMTKKAIEKIQSGQMIKVMCDAPASAEDSIPKYCEKTGHKFESIRVEDKGYWELYIQKA